MKKKWPSFYFLRLDVVTDKSAKYSAAICQCCLSPVRSGDKNIPVKPSCEAILAMAK